MAGINSELIHKTSNACCSKIIKKTKENNKNCLGSQIETFKIRIGNWLELTHCDGSTRGRGRIVQQSKLQGCRICGSVVALLPGTFFLPGTFYLKMKSGGMWQLSLW